MQRIFIEQLPAHLQTKLVSIYYLVGQDPLLLNESLEMICKAAQGQGFDEKNEWQIESGTDWNLLFEQTQSMGLFFNRQIIVLHLPENLNVVIQNQLNELIGLLHSDILLVLCLPKLSKTVEKQTWFTQSLQREPHAVQIHCQTPTREQLPRWISHRIKSMGAETDNDAIELLCYSYENNLLALKQCLQLLALLYTDNKFTFSRVQHIVEQSSVFTPFQWIDAILEGKVKRATRILEGLKSEDIQPIILLRTFQREIMQLLSLTQPQQRINSLDEPLPMNQLREQFDRLKIWQNRRPLLTQAIQRLTYRKLYLLIQQLADIERLAKQEFSDEVWDRLNDLALKMG